MRIRRIAIDAGAVHELHFIFMAQSIIELQALRKVFNETVAVDGVSMAIERGQIFGFLGANGAGKTTTMRMLCGLTRPTGGPGVDRWEGYLAGPVCDPAKVRVRGAEVQPLSGPDGAGEPAVLRRGVPRAGGGDGEADGACCWGRQTWRRKRTARAGSLSGGMKQLLAVACALIHEPLLLFLDEPTSGLDPVHRQQMWDLLYDLSSKGTTIFVTTHYMDEAERCTEVGFLDKGRLLVKNSPQGLKESFASRLLELEVEPIMPALAALRDAPGVLGVSLRSGRARIYAGDAEALLAEWQRRVALPGDHGCWGTAGWSRIWRMYSRRTRRATLQMLRTGAGGGRGCVASTGILSVAYKETLHILRDRRILVLVIALPPLLTLIFGYAFDSGAMTNVPVSIQDRDQSEASAGVRKSDRDERGVSNGRRGLRTGRSRCAGPAAGARVQGSLIIPGGWGQSLKNGKPEPLQLWVDGSDTNTGDEISGELQQALGDFQLKSRRGYDRSICPWRCSTWRRSCRRRCGMNSARAMEPWTVETTVLYNPQAAVHRLRHPGDHRADPAIADGDADGLHRGAGTGERERCIS